MKNIILTTFILAASASASASQISLETAGRCYEATRQSTQMAMLLDPDAKEYKNIGDNNAMRNPEIAAKCAAKLKGRISAFLGKTQTESARKAISESIKNYPEITCERCGKSFKPWHYARYHGEKCNVEI